MTVMTNTNMKIKIQYPETKCAYCGKTFKKTHNRQTYCSTECRQKGDREKANLRWRKWYHKNKQKLYQKQLGTRTIGPRRNPDTKREAEIVSNEKDRILNSKSFDYNMNMI